MTQFEKLYYCPVSSLYLPFKNRFRLIKIFEEQSRQIFKKTSADQYSYWQGITCYKSPLFQEKNLLYPGPEINCQEYLQDEISILEKLPLDIESISLWRNTKPVPGHKDATVYEDQKFDFRFRFFLNSDEPSFFIQKGLKKILINESVDSNIFFFNNENCLHGSEYFPHSKKILGVIRGRLRQQDFITFAHHESLMMFNKSICSKDFDD